jgi:hypothetical protein
MENTDNIERISTTIKTNLGSKINLQELIDHALLKSILVTIRSRSGLYYDNDGNSDANQNDGTRLDEQYYKDFAELAKNKVTREINEAITTSF